MLEASSPAIWAAHKPGGHPLGAGFTGMKNTGAVGSSPLLPRFEQESGRAGSVPLKWHCVKMEQKIQWRLWMLGKPETWNVRRKPQGASPRKVPRIGNISSVIEVCHPWPLVFVYHGYNFPWILEKELRSLNAFFWWISVLLSLYSILSFYFSLLSREVYSTTLHVSSV